MPHACRRVQAAVAAVIALASLQAATGCASPQECAGRGEPTVLERGHSAQHQAWQLAASEHCGLLGLYLENSSRHQYSGAEGFNGDPSGGFWMEGSGPGGSDFLYGPAPAAAVTARLSAARHVPILVPTRPLPVRAGLPRGRFFILQNPGPVSANWNATLLDSAGHKVAFTDF